MIEHIIAKELGLKVRHVENVVRLLDEGNTIPFIARYRKEETGSMEDVTLRELDQRLTYLRNLEEEKEKAIRLIDEEGKLTEELREELMKAETLQRVADLYRPFQKKRRTRATIAKEKGLSPLAKAIVREEPKGQDFFALADSFVSEEKEVETREEAIQHAMDIVAEDVSDSADIRATVKDILVKHGFIESKAVDEEAESVYENYYDYREAYNKLPSHRILAINRGEKEKFLRVKLLCERIDLVEKIIIDLVEDREGVPGNYKALAVEDGMKRLLLPSVERELRTELTEMAEEEAIKVFALNIKPLLMQPPLRDKRVLAIDPGFRTGCKLAVVDETGKLLDFATIYPTEPRNDVLGSIKTMKDLIKKYDVDVISIGNGTGSRETEAVVAKMLAEIEEDVQYIVTNEAGASIYSASEVGVAEFPDIDVSIRGAVSIGRRIQDPLSELVKIEPKHIGVGQYQHDLNQKKLEETLQGVVEDSVNAVGADLNTASSSLLRYIAGISKKNSEEIVSYRNKNGRFKNIFELKKVKGIGPKTFEQAAGFLRIPGGEEPLDNTGVHPESYEAAKKLLQMDYRSMDRGNLAVDLNLGLETLEDIIEDLERPGRDIRDSLPAPILKSDVVKIEDLKEGMTLKGTVRNVVDFGAFVDIGVKTDGLVHISQLSDKFVKHPSQVVKLGDIIEVEILEIDIERDRIALRKI